MKKIFQTIVLERFMSPAELAEFEKKYDAHKKALRSSNFPTADDWAMFDRGATLQEFMNKWEVIEQTAVAKIGKMFVRSNSRKSA